jgi:hypothetical protein
MHRSGTSLTASFLEAAGIKLGEVLLQADCFNVKGYFEDVEFLEFQRSVLQNSCRTDEPGWQDWGWTESEFLDYNKFQNYLDEAKALINNRYLKAEIWGWKDPRTSLMLNFWDELLPDAHYIFVYRLPWEVADSIFRVSISANNGFTKLFAQHPYYALKIWSFYNRHIVEFYKKHSKRCVLVSINALTQKPEQLIELLRDKFGITQEISNEVQHQFQKIYESKIFKNIDLAHPSVRILQHTAPQYFELLKELEQMADVPSKISLELTDSDSPLDREKSLLLFHRQTLEDRWKLKQSQSQLQQTQAELEQSQFQQQHTQAELEQSQFQQQHTQAELEQSQSQLQQTQAELEQSQFQQQHIQAELEQSQSQQQHTQAELEQSQFQQQHIQAELEQSQSQQQHTQAELEQSQFQLQHTQAKLERSQQRVAAMESSKFWQFRKVWLRMKRMLGLETDE